jgi:hypothetical protein
MESVKVAVLTAQNVSYNLQIALNVKLLIFFLIPFACPAVPTV